MKSVWDQPSRCSWSWGRHVKPYSERAKSCEEENGGIKGVLCHTSRGPEPSFLHFPNSQHLTYGLWMHLLMLNQQDQARHPQGENNEGTRRSPQIEVSYVALWFKVLNGTFASINWNRVLWGDNSGIFMTWLWSIWLQNLPEYWMFLKPWGMKDILYFIFLAPFHLIFFSYRHSPYFSFFLIFQNFIEV